MSVPKCKECKYHSYETDGWAYSQKHHTCYHPNIKSMVGKFIPAKDTKTSPGWCPLRKDENYMNDLLNKYGRNK